MTDDGDAAWRRLHAAAAAPYRAAGRFAFHFARGKLGRDPVFRQLVATGCIAPGARVLDLGCGQGLLAALLRAVDADMAWPGGWAPAPRGTRVTGVERNPREVARARAALGGAATVVHADIRGLPLPPCYCVVLLDVLHYIAPAEQDALLARVAGALVPGGRLLLRVGAAGARGHGLGVWVDRVVARARGHRVAPGSARTIEAWSGALRGLGFAAVVAHPMSQGTPFANTLLVCDLASTIAPCSTTPPSKP